MVDNHAYFRKCNLATILGENIPNTISFSIDRTKFRFLKSLTKSPDLRLMSRDTLLFQIKLNSPQQCLFLICCWLIWITRNNFIFPNEPLEFYKFNVFTKAKSILTILETRTMLVCDYSSSPFSDILESC